MRKIKLKAWDKVKKCWIKANVIAWCDEEKQWMINADGYGWINPEEVEVVEFTGLPDKNSKEIYEGDIVHKSKELGTWSVEYDDTEGRFVVYNQLNSQRDLKSHTCGYEIYHLKDGDLATSVEITDDSGFVCEVIGNIYENPELLRSE